VDKAAHDFIIGSARVVTPGRLLHDTAGDGLKVVQVEALRQQGLLGDAQLALLLLGILSLLLQGDGGHVDGPEVLGLVEVLVQRVRRVDGVKLLRRIFALRMKG
jgi:hypothetical protein